MIYYSFTKKCQTFAGSHLKSSSNYLYIFVFFFKQNEQFEDVPVMKGSLLLFSDVVRPKKKNKSINEK